MVVFFEGKLICFDCSKIVAMVGGGVCEGLLLDDKYLHGSNCDLVLLLFLILVKIESRTDVGSLL